MNQIRTRVLQRGAADDALRRIVRTTLTYAEAHKMLPCSDDFLAAVPARVSTSSLQHRALAQLPLADLVHGSLARLAHVHIMLDLAAAESRRRAGVQLCRSGSTEAEAEHRRFR